MSLYLYNTLAKDKVLFKPLEENKVKIYLCGPTVYDLLHVGNFRGAIFFNTLRNWFEHIGYEATMVYNYTDVDDKIIKKANEEGVDTSVITERYIEAFETDFGRLGLKKHDHNPRVTDHMDDIISMVKTLIENDKAYVVDGEVFYAIDNFEEYGKLSGKKLEDLEAGQRVEVDSKKKNPFDFVLWKPAKEGEPSWESPWGSGRPGWHIECSAMIKAILGDTIDIHGGGIDLIFPHHENEIAQGEGCNCQKYCNYWVHNEFINFGDEKMSKSLGNVVTGRAFMDRYSAEVLKFLMLSAHYRSTLSLTDDKAHQAMSGLSRIYNALNVAHEVRDTFENTGAGKVNKAFAQQLVQSEAKIKKSMNDDIGTGEAISHIFDVVRSFNGLNLVKKKKDQNSHPTAVAFIEWIEIYGKIMALFEQKPSDFLSEIKEILLKEKNIDKTQVEDLIAKRTQARDEKNWELSDKLRDDLLAMSIEFNDTPDGVVWHVKI